MAQPSKKIKDIEAKPKVYWAVPMGQTIGVDAFNSLMNVSMVCGAYNMPRLPIGYMRTDLARNSLIKTFLKLSESPDDTLVMLDNDHIHPHDIVARLSGYSMGVVGALAYRRGEPFDPIIFVRTGDDGKLHPLAGWPENAVVECDMVGHGAIAIKRWVFDKLTEIGRGAPFYRYEYREDGTAPSEDMYFGESCAKAGIKHYCDTGVVIPHLINYGIDGKDWQKWLDQNPGSIKTINEPEEKQAEKISVIMPSIGRPQQLRKCIDRLFETTKGHDIECLVITNDTDSIDALQGLVSVDNLPVKIIVDTCTAIQGWNVGASKASGDWLVLAADDLWWGDDWLTKALATPNKGFIGLPDGHTSSSLSTHYMASRDWLKRYNGGVLAIPHYTSWYIDVETSERAQRSGTYAYAADALVEHRHVAWGTAEDDATYQLRRPAIENDKQIYAMRKAIGFPDDFEAVIK